MGTGKLKVIVVDDHTLFRGGLMGLLDRSGVAEVVGEASNGRQFLDMLETVVPDVVLMDIDMPVMSGDKAAEEALGRYPDLKIITLSMHGDQEYYFRMVSLGAKGFLLKSSDVDEVLTAITTVARGGTFFSQELLHSLVDILKTSDATHHEVLSDREKEIVLLICKGMSNSEIGEKLFISKRTVDKHRANILEKTNSKNTANLVVYAIKNGLVEI